MFLNGWSQSIVATDLRQRGNAHNDALRRVSNRFVGILHGCLKTRTRYDETIAWKHEVTVTVD